ncbi:MAG: hypothetical protein WC529_01295 [Candidatus Margulisiibacteriota bacterium]
MKIVYSFKEIAKQLGEEYEKQNPPDFITHLNYVKCLEAISKDISLDTSLSIEKAIECNINVKNKVNLIKLTLDSLEQEKVLIQKNPEYAVVCVSWISVKAYYVIFNMCLLLKYLVTCNKDAFNSTHSSVLGWLKDHIERKEILFSDEKFNRLVNIREALKLKIKSGSNIKRSPVDVEERLTQIFKKLANYSIEEFRRTNRIKTLHNKKSKAMYSKYIDESFISLFDFFYWYRIKANYRDLEYLNKDIHDEQFKEYFLSYYGLLVNLYKPLGVLINKIAMVRIGHNII